MTLFSVNGYQHTFGGIRHVWERPGHATLSVRTSGADLVPRGATVERTRRRRFLPYQLTGWGNLTNGNDQGGQGIDLQPEWRSDTLVALDGTIERHPVCAFTASGDLLTRTQLGYGFEYVPANDKPTVQRIPAISGSVPNVPAATWERIDPAHLVRAFGPAVAAWKHSRDVVAFWWLQVIANDVMLSYADQKIVGGSYSTWSLAQMAENAATTYSAATPGGRKGTAAFGELRAHAWSLRAVVEAYRALVDGSDPASDSAPLGLGITYRNWIRTFIRLVHDVQADNGALTCNDYLHGQDQSQPWFTDQLAGTPDRHAPYLLRFDELEIPTFQVPFMIRALYEAQALLQDTDCTAMVREIVRKWMHVYRTCPLVPSEYGSGAYGLPHYIVVQNADGLVPALTSGIGKATDGQYAPDVRVVARAMGVRA